MASSRVAAQISGARSLIVVSQSELTMQKRGSFFKLRQR